MSDNNKKPKVNGTELIKYVVSECSHFFSNLVYSLEAAVARGELPRPNNAAWQQKAGLLADVDIEDEDSKGKKVLKGGKAKIKRKPTAFNIYIGKKVEQGKQAGLSHTENFKEAVASWKRLSDDQKKAYTALCLQNPADIELNNLPVPDSHKAAIASPLVLSSPVDEDPASESLEKLTDGTDTEIKKKKRKKGEEGHDSKKKRKKDKGKDRKLATLVKQV